MARVDDAVDGLSAREAEALMARLEKRLRACILCKADGAEAVSAKRRNSHARLSLMLCPACIERHRLPESRATDG